MTSYNKKRTIVITSVFVIFTGLIIMWTLWANTALELTTHTVVSSRLPASFDGYRIAHISDLHNAEMGQNNNKLLKMLSDAQPDIIAITGDIVDSRHTDINVALHFAKEALKVAPCYYVPGNNESWIGEYDALRDGLISLGVVVLEDSKVALQLDGDKINVFGVIDPSFYGDMSWDEEADVVDSALNKIINNNDYFTILLSHRPELIDIYVKYHCDLVLSGHAHGGQFRLPFIGGLIAPNQGVFPKYDSGLYVQDHTQMVVSRGIGNSIIPLRVNNRPEVVLVELKKAK